MTELKPGTVFLLRTRAGRKVVVKRSDAPWSEASAAAIGRLARIPTVPARPVRRGAWSATAALPFAGPPDELLLVLPWIDAPTLAVAQVAFNAHQLGALWAFDVLIDNSDRLVKGGNPFNILVAGDGSLFALDQRLGPAVSGDVDAGRVTRRRLLGAASLVQRQELARRIFADFRNEAGVAAHGHLARAFAHGVAAGVRAIASLTEAALQHAIAAAGGRPHVATRGFPDILREFRAAAT